MIPICSVERLGKWITTIVKNGKVKHIFRKLGWSES